MQFALVDGNLQFCCPFLPFLPGKFALALLEGGQFLLRRLKEAVAWWIEASGAIDGVRNDGTHSIGNNTLSPRAAGRSAARKITEL